MYQHHTSTVVKITLSVSALIFLCTTVFYFGVTYQKIEGDEVRLDKLEVIAQKNSDRFQDIKNALVQLNQKVEDGK